MLVECILEITYGTSVMCLTMRFVIILMCFVMYLPTVPRNVECVFTGIRYHIILICIEDTIYR